MALGTTNITPIEMAAAYGAIANGGEYQEPLSFTRIVDESGKVILDADEIREKHTVFKKSTAYMLVDILTEAVNSGTGTNAKISGMTVAGQDRYQLGLRQRVLCRYDPLLYSYRMDRPR